MRHFFPHFVDYHIFLIFQGVQLILALAVTRKTTMTVAEAMLQNMPKKQCIVAEYKEKLVFSRKRESSPTRVVEFVKVAGGSLLSVLGETKPHQPIWKVSVDSATGRKYYYNRITCQTTWKKPAGFNEPIESELTGNVGGQGVEGREPSSCSLDETSAVSPGDKHFVIESARSKQKESSKLEKVLPSTKIAQKDPACASGGAEATMQPIYAEGVKLFNECVPDVAHETTPKIAFFKCVVDHPFNDTCGVRDELEKVAELFERAKSGKEESTELASIVDSEESKPAKVLGPMLTTDVSSAPDYEVRDTMAPDDELRGSLTTRDELAEFLDGEHTEILDDKNSETAADVSTTTTVDTQLKETVWKDLLFL